MTNTDYLFERERYVKKLWEIYNQIISSLKHLSWFEYVKEYYKPKMVPIQRVVEAPKIKAYNYIPEPQIRYFVTDPASNKIINAYLLTPPKTLY